MDETQNSNSNDFNPFIVEEPDVESNSQPDNADTQQLVIDQPEVADRKTHPKLSFGGDSLKSGEVVYESKYSRYKQAFLSKFIENHIRALGGAASFEEDRPYIFMDLYGGLGLYRDRSDDTMCAGSPILFYTKLDEAGIPYKGLVYEKNETRAEALTSSLYHVKDDVTVINDDNVNFVEGFKNALVGTRWDSLYTSCFSENLIW